MNGKIEPPLLRLPLELRQQIYDLVFDPPRVVDLLYVNLELEDDSRSTIYRSKSEKLHDSDYSLSEWKTGILEVSRTISSEALDVLYGRHMFVVGIWERSYRKLLNFPVANLRRIRYLRVNAQLRGISHEKPLVFDSQPSWLPLLEGLRHFCLVAHQMTQEMNQHNPRIVENERCAWIYCMDPIMEYFSTNLPKTTAVFLDDDNRADTTALMNKHFGPDHQKVRTTYEEYCFDLKRYISEIGYCDGDGQWHFHGYCDRRGRWRWHKGMGDPADVTRAKMPRKITTSRRRIMIRSPK